MKSWVSEICVNQIGVNQGVGVLTDLGERDSRQTVLVDRKNDKSEHHNVVKRIYDHET